MHFPIVLHFDDKDFLVFIFHHQIGAIEFVALIFLIAFANVMGQLQVGSADILSAPRTGRYDFPPMSEALLANQYFS